MLFNSVGFLIFFPIVLLVCFAIPEKIRYLWLLAASYYFYMCWNAKYAVLLLTSTVITYASGLLLERVKGLEIDEIKKIRYKKAVVALSFISNLGILCYFKYINFIIFNLTKAFSLININLSVPAVDVILPVGISFYTFMAVGYIVDVYRGKTRAVRHFGKYAIFVSFFPNISSGPIERAGHFIPQIDKEKSFDYDSVVYGARLLLLGLIKKIVIADMMTKYVDEVFNKVPEHYGICFAWATLLYTFQIYCDFSGYSDMAVGAARMLGFDLIQNFRQPYLAASIKEFWARWHISLSTWFRDYVYIPLGGNRCSKTRRDMNLLITFLCSGLWHGASWTFVLWGGIHGVCQIIENRIKERIGLTGEKEKALENWHRAVQFNSTSPTLEQKIRQQKYLE